MVSLLFLMRIEDVEKISVSDYFFSSFRITFFVEELLGIQA